MQEYELEYEESALGDEFFNDDTPDAPTVNQANFYVDPAEFLAAFKEYEIKRDAAYAAGAEFYPIPKYIAECFIKICNHLSYRYNFIAYSWRDDMIADGILSCIKGCNSFSSERSPQIFSYFTRTAFYAFVNRIKKEKAEAEIKGELIYEMDMDSIVRQEQDSGELGSDFVEWIKISQDFKRRPAKEKIDKIKNSNNEYPELFFDAFSEDDDE